MQHILAIDPSVNSIGWAALPFPYPEDCLFRLKGSWRFNCYKLPQGAILKDKLRYLDKWLQQLQLKFDIQYVIIEQPGFHHSQAGYIAARQGWIIQLGFLVGYIIARLDCTENHTLIPPAQWKGMVPKLVTFKKFQRTFVDHTNWKWQDSDNDIIDAIMLLHYWISQKHTL